LVRVITVTLQSRLLLLRLRFALLFGLRMRISIDILRHLLRIDYLRAEKCDYDSPDFDDPDYDGPGFTMEPLPPNTALIRPITFKERQNFQMCNLQTNKLKYE
jgi:hypothetical protein